MSRPAPKTPVPMDVVLQSGHTRGAGPRERSRNGPHWNAEVLAGRRGSRMMTRTPDDPRSEAEKARADLKRNDEMSGPALSETPLTHRPSVTADTFGEHWNKARALSGATEGVEA